ncbi:hypothetical protein P12x_002580 [Tundrisphaera lichenicola]|uniref:hypothetical protein n=1 Tax=Tundrisphaera lichenicola TaxID=2029860 RepID=UPI003EC0F21F
MVPTLLTTSLVAWIFCLVRYPFRPVSAVGSAHPPEGYFFGDPESPTRAEREARTLQFAGSSR